ncbi:hypothetical protein J0895_23040 [Phormidium pseudopriestleyi FRX01]|uniref:Uncharacterized protein n=1 Tax=Phormidium pseudopriestleyi FRX01 TaxID=1759528 RepID=A0ABS3FXN6_9CYAN|nr:hypothetical protein [Phormidium pseudopriestleyi]MBO0351905.1 hypothetical protein [Phormidium pseudopriestleyi FRX01]
MFLLCPSRDSPGVAPGGWSGLSGDRHSVVVRQITVEGNSYLGGIRYPRSVLVR